MRACIRQYNTEIEDNPDNAKAYLNRAVCFMQLHNYEETLNDAMQSTKLNDARYLIKPCLLQTAAKLTIPC